MKNQIAAFIEQLPPEYKEFENIVVKLQVELYDHRWRAVSVELPNKIGHLYCSEWVVATDGEKWTIARYNYEYTQWQKDHSPYDLNMKPVTHWKPIICKVESDELDKSKSG